jgi:hypothetical protein
MFAFCLLLEAAAAVEDDDIAKNERVSIDPTK